MTKTHKIKENKFEWDFPHKSIFRRSFDFLSQYLASFPVSPTEDLLPPGFPNIDMGPQLKVVERTRTATMLCSASGKPDPEITWYKDFLPIDPNTSDGRIKQLRSGKKSLCYDFFVVFFLLQEILALPISVDIIRFCFYKSCAGIPWFDFSNWLLINSVRIKVNYIST